VIGEATLLLAHLRERHPETAQFLRYVHAQIACLTQLLKIFSEETVFAVIEWGTLSTAGQDIVGQNLLVNCHGHTLPPSWVALHDITVDDGFAGRECI